MTSWHGPTYRCPFPPQPTPIHTPHALAILCQNLFTSVQNSIVKSVNQYHGILLDGKHCDMYYVLVHEYR